MFKFIFFISIAGLFYVYAGYPVVVCLAARWRRKRVFKKPWEPSVSILIAAHNEEKTIAETIRNKLELDYPADKIEIIVVSDASTDATDRLVQEFEGETVRLLRQEPRAGKTSALNMAVPLAKGEIIVFSDANSLYDAQAMRKLLANFADAEVGYVTGKMVYTYPDGTFVGDGCSAYMRYENFLRENETCLGSIIGVDGGIDAMRKDLYQSLNPDQLPDFVQPLKVVEQGFRVVYEPDAILKEPSLQHAADEYRMRVRVALRSLWALYDMRSLLFFRKNPVFSWQLWSHKLLRYLCFFFLIALFLSNFFLFGVGFGYRFFFLLQIMAYAAVLAAPVLQSWGYSPAMLGFARYFALLNFASAHAFVNFLRRRKQVIWTPRKG